MNESRRTVQIRKTRYVSEVSVALVVPSTRLVSVATRSFTFVSRSDPYYVALSSSGATTGLPLLCCTLVLFNSGIILYSIAKSSIENEPEYI